jgi:hypothetical protein
MEVYSIWDQYWRGSEIRIIFIESSKDVLVHISIKWVEVERDWLNSSRVKLVKYFELKNLAQGHLVTIWVSSRFNVCVLTCFNDIFTILIWTSGLTKNYRVKYMSLVTNE